MNLLNNISVRTYACIPHVFRFKNPSGTSRGVMTQKKSWFVVLEGLDGTKGWGECSIIENLSPDYHDDYSYELQLRKFLDKILDSTLTMADLEIFPSMRFGIETALLDLKTGGTQRLFQTNFIQGKRDIRINGLIWMGSSEEMKKQIEDKLAAGFACIKMKIGAIDWREEYKLIRQLRATFSSKEIEIRVDANGAFHSNEAPKVLDQLAELDVHSIEQPILAGQWELMAELCATTPCPIALDEELIGVFGSEKKKKLLEQIAPQYIILKPSLHGGISGTQEWIALAGSYQIPWWMTSALESNIGLNAIAQLASTYDLHLPQGLGTGNLYLENVPSPLELEGEKLSFSASGYFDFSLLRNQ